MTIIRERYSTAINARSLVVDERTRMSDTDVLAAMAFADRALTTGKHWKGKKEVDIPKAPLAAPLARLFAGDNKAAHVLVRVMAQMVFDHAEGLQIKIARHYAMNLARACLAYSRNGTCRDCGGHGKLKIPGTNVLGDRDCKSCFDRVRQESTGRVPFESLIRAEHRELAKWLLAEMERETARVWPEAARALAAKMDF